LKDILPTDWTEQSGINTSTMDIHLVTHSLWEVITIATVSAIVSLITIVGNVLVMVSFKVNSQLKTVNNYYLLSLAAADLIIGVFSMNLYTSYILMGYWALGNLACDLWLALDYVASNASVMNLLVISFDRYFSITRPLTYRAKRTPKRAGIMIGLAWLVSLVLWAPPILCWQYFVGKRTVPERQCQIQFFSEPVITFGTAIAAFYVPVSVMTILYCRIYKETEKRTKDLAELQGINCSTESGVAQPQKTIIRSCFSCKLSSASQDRNQASWSSSTRSNAVKSAATTSDEWSKAGQLTTFNSYASSEDEDSKCVSYKNGDTKITSPTFSSAESMKKKDGADQGRKAAQTLSAILLAFILTWTPYNIMVLISTFCSQCIPVSSGTWATGCATSTAPSIPCATPFATRPSKRPSACSYSASGKEKD
uniref:Muscarinic acetylcholine receptor n=1 Tax=Maylandia zebra TaxID=106582 RepID=A0A3P9BSQ6_9CICH